METETITILDVVIAVLAYIWRVISSKYFYKPFILLMAVIGITVFFNYYTLISPVTVKIGFRNPLITREVKVVEKSILSPVAMASDTTPSTKIEVQTVKKSWNGLASFYSSDMAGCVGCAVHFDKDSNMYFLMANGERLDNAKKTLALGRTFIKNEGIALNSDVRITNIKTNKSEMVKVTDTGNFDIEYGRLADMSVALRDSLDCGDLCDVKIEIF